MKNTNFVQVVSVLANLGVLAGIVFLAFELRQNNEQLAAQSRFNYYQQRIAQTRSLADDPQLIDLVLKSRSGELLTESEQVRVSQLISTLFVAWEFEYGEWERGLITDEEFNVAAKRATWEPGARMMNQFWEAYKATGPKRFVEFIESEVMFQ
jgi:hypothetical protein